MSRPTVALHGGLSDAMGSNFLFGGFEDLWLTEDDQPAAQNKDLASTVLDVLVEPGQIRSARQ